MNLRPVKSEIFKLLLNATNFVCKFIDQISSINHSEQQNVPSIYHPFPSSQFIKYIFSLISCLIPILSQSMVPPANRHEAHLCVTPVLSYGCVDLLQRRTGHSAGSHHSSTSARAGLQRVRAGRTHARACAAVARHRQPENK